MTPSQVHRTNCRPRKFWNELEEKQNFRQTLALPCRLRSTIIVRFRRLRTTKLILKRFEKLVVPETWSKRSFVIDVQPSKLKLSRQKTLRLITLLVTCTPMKFKKISNQSVVFKIPIFGINLFIIYCFLQRISDSSILIIFRVLSLAKELTIKIGI